MDPYAPEAQIQRLTGKVYGPAQCRALDRLGIPYTVNDKGRPLVLLANIPGHTNRERREWGRPRFDQI